MESGAPVKQALRDLPIHYREKLAEQRARSVGSAFARSQASQTACFACLINHTAVLRLAHYPPIYPRRSRSPDLNRASFVLLRHFLAPLSSFPMSLSYFCRSSRASLQSQSLTRACLSPTTSSVVRLTRSAHSASVARLLKDTMAPHADDRPSANLAYAHSDGPTRHVHPSP